MAGFQQSVNIQPAYAVAGDFASNNPRASVVAGEGSFVSGSNGVEVGRFAWVMPDGQTVYNTAQTANVAPDGFVHRDQQASIVEYLGEASGQILPGQMVTLQRSGDYYATLTGTTAATRAAVIRADYSTGEVFVGDSQISAFTATVGASGTATIAEGALSTLVVADVTAGYISVGDTVSGTGIAAGTTITAQVSGTPGGAGSYTLSVAQAAAITTAADITTFGNVINVASVTAGTVGVGYPVVTTAGGLSNPVITAALGGSLYRVNQNATSAVTTAASMTQSRGVATDFRASNNCAVGELVIISK